MRSKFFLKGCLLVGALFCSAAAAPVWAANDTGASSQHAEPGLIDRMRDFFHRLGGGSEAAEAAEPQSDKLVYLTPEQREQMRDQIRQQWQSASPEERQKRREEFRERWDSATPEQREQMRERAKDRWEQLSPEQRQQIRQHIEDRSGRAGAPAAPNR